MANVGLSDLCRDCSKLCCCFSRLLMGKRKRNQVWKREKREGVLRRASTKQGQGYTGNEVRRHLEVPRRLPGWKEGGLGRIERKGGGDERREEGKKGWGWGVGGG